LSELARESPDPVREPRSGWPHGTVGLTVSPFEDDGSFDLEGIILLRFVLTSETVHLTSLRLDWGRGQMRVSLQPPPVREC
jgi:hypothetical protein